MPDRLRLQTRLSLNLEEAKMLHKTMVLELLQQQPEFHDQLKSQRMLQPVLDFYDKKIEHRINADQPPHKVLFDLLKHIVKS